jgi:hypothetical protein
MSAGLLKHVESLLAAHYYSILDPQAQQKTVGDASDTYPQRDWWKEAVKLDLTGTLASMETGSKKVQLVHLGTSPRFQRHPWER